LLLSLFYDAPYGETMPYMCIVHRSYEYKFTDD